MFAKVNDIGMDRIRVFSCPLSMKSILEQKLDEVQTGPRRKAKERPMRDMADKSKAKIR